MRLDIKRGYNLLAFDGGWPEEDAALDGGLPILDMGWPGVRARCVDSLCTRNVQKSLVFLVDGCCRRCLHGSCGSLLCWRGCGRFFLDNVPRCPCVTLPWHCLHQ